MVQRGRGDIRNGQNGARGELRLAFSLKNLQGRGQDRFSRRHAMLYSDATWPCL
jgi:hypothetical protein